MSQLPGMPQGSLPPGQQAPAQPQPIGIGSLIIFHYMQWKNDPTPVVIVSSAQPGGLLKGVNLHYLSFPYVKRALGMGGGNSSFSYYNIKADRYLAGAFRSYFWQGIDFGSMRVLDTKFLLQTMRMVNSFDPLQIRAIRQQIESQLNQQVGQPQAGPSAPQPYGSSQNPPA